MAKNEKCLHPKSDPTVWCRPMEDNRKELLEVVLSPSLSGIGVNVRRHLRAATPAKVH